MLAADDRAPKERLVVVSAIRIVRVTTADLDLLRVRAPEEHPARRFPLAALDMERDSCKDVSILPGARSAHLTCYWPMGR